DEVPAKATTPFQVITQPLYRGRVIMLSVFHFFQPFSINGFGLLVPLILRAKGLTIQDSLAYSAISYREHSVILALPICRQDKRQEAHDLLTPVYHWFTVGFDAADLKDAKVLLDELT